MSKKIVAVNAGPRKGWNTDTLITEAAKGAESAGAEIIKFDLFRLEKYTGCIYASAVKKKSSRDTASVRTGWHPFLMLSERQTDLSSARRITCPR